MEVAIRLQALSASRNKSKEVQCFKLITIKLTFIIFFFFKLRNNPFNVVFTGSDIEN